MGGTQVAAEYLVLKLGLLTAHEVARGEACPSEQKRMELILGEIMMRTGGSRDDAIELFLEACLTENQDGMSRVLGVEPSQVINLEQSDDGWQAHKISKALVNTGDRGEISE